MSVIPAGTPVIWRIHNRKKPHLGDLVWDGKAIVRAEDYKANDPKGDRQYGAIEPLKNQKTWFLGIAAFAGLAGVYLLTSKSKSNQSKEA